MRVWNSLHYGLGACAAVAMVGCGSGGLQSQSSGSMAIPQRAGQAVLNAPAQAGAPKTAGIKRESNGSWMDSDVSRDNLLYVTDDTNPSYVYVFKDKSNESKDTLVGTLTGFSNPLGDCSDQAGDVFILNQGPGTIVEYAHGGTSPIATLSDPADIEEGCSVDPTTGNLAVANIYHNGSGPPGGVVVYTPPYTGTPTVYSDSDLNQAYFCSYDRRGNLFVDGDVSNSFALTELPKGSSTFRTISLNQSISVPGGVQWVGKYLAVGDEAASTIYEFTIRRGAGTEVGSTPLTGASEVFQFAIQGDRVFAPNKTGGLGVAFYPYPAGGTATMNLFAPPYYPYSVTVSKGSN